VLEKVGEGEAELGSQARVESRTGDGIGHGGWTNYVLEVSLRVLVDVPSSIEAPLRRELRQ
jgi:hypothetical protein